MCNKTSRRGRYLGEVRERTTHELGEGVEKYPSQNPTYDGTLAYANSTFTFVISLEISVAFDGL
jgi:hypothetical protein